jgi:Fungal specific transcription factor domain
MIVNSDQEPIYLDLPMLGYNHPPVASQPRAPEMFEYTEMPQRLRDIAATANIPNEFMQYISQIAELAQWKSSQTEQGSLSYRELARRGRAIEDLLLGERRREAPARFLERYGDFSGDGQGLGTPLSDFSWSEHSNSDIAFLGDPHVPLALPPTFSNDFFTQPASIHVPPAGYPTAGYMQHPAFGRTHTVGYQTNPAGALYPLGTQVARPTMPSPTELIHREACLLFLHSIVSGPNPRVPEIEISVHNLFARFSNLAPNELTPDLGFAACLAGCLAIPGEQEFFRSTLARITAQDLRNEAHLLIDEVVGQRTTHHTEQGIPNFPHP